MANSKSFLGDINIHNFKLGTKDVKLYLGDNLIYPTSTSLADAVVTCGSATYNAQTQIAEEITVVLSGNTLTKDVDYNVTQNSGGLNVGKYTVEVTGINNYEGTASGTFTINKVTPTVTAPTPLTSLVYNGNAQALINNGSTNWGALQYSLDNSTYSTSIPSGTNATAYTVYYRVVGDSNINDVAAQSVSVSISKVTPTVVAPTPKVLTYNGSSQELANAGSTDFGALKYKVGSDSWSTSVPTRTRSGSYELYYKVDGDSNVYDVPSAITTCSINEKKVTATVTLSQTTYTYNGSACEPTPTVKDGTTVIDPSEYTVTYSNNVNAGTATVTISDNVGGNYEVIGSATFTINKAAGSVTTVPVNNNYTYNGTSRAAASAGSGTGTMYYRLGTSGSFSTTMPTMTNAGSNTLYYYAAASTNYEQSSTGSIVVSVQKANISPTVSISNWTYGNSASNPSVVGNSGGGTVTYYYKSTSSSSWSTTKPSNAGNYNIRADIAATTNYNSGTCTNSFTINKANPTYTAPTTKSLTYNGYAQSLLNAGSTNHGTIQYSSNASNWSTTIPSQTNANTYTTYWKLVGDSNHNDVSSKSISTTIAKASQSAPTATGATTTYNTIATATASGGGGQGSLEWESTQSQTSVGSHSTRARWSGNSNYNASPWSNSVTVQMNKANQSAPTATGATVYEGSTATATASGGGGQGSLEWSNGSTRTAIGSQTTKARWSGNDNYNASSWSNEVTLRVYAPHAYVEIGGLKWATMNIGANSITDYGLYFQWGDTQGYTASQVGSGEGQKYFDWADYKYGNGQSWPGATGMTKYNETDGRTVLEASDDAAKAAWGGNWRMPTASEFIALGEAVTSAWTADYQGSGVAGMICTDKTDSSKTLFFPAAGSCYEGRLTRVDDGGSYWSSSLYAKDRQNAFGFGFNGSVAYWGGNGGRRGGFAVRPVVG